MKLTICGGGGFRVPLVLQALASARGRVAIDEVVLHDVDAARLTRIAGVWEGLAGGAEQGACPDAGACPDTTMSSGPGFTLRTTTDLEGAVRGAAVVFSAIRVGGGEGRVGDERAAMAVGLLGQETVGAGGLTYALRTLPVTDALARTVASVAPEAWVINFTNPAGIITESMRDIHERVVGICDTPIGLVRRALHAVGLPRRAFDAGEVAVDYAGLNHLGWLRGLRTPDGTDHLPRVTDDAALAARFEEARLVGTDWVRATGALPNEYVYYYVHARRAREALTAAPETRGELIIDQQERFAQAADAALAAGDAVGAARAWQDAAAERNATYMATELTEQGADGDEFAQGDAGDEDAGGGYHEVAIDLMSALLGDEEHRMILDLPNQAPGAPAGTPIVPALDARAVVEVPVRASRHRVVPEVPAVLPAPEEQALMAALKASERLTIRAARALAAGQDCAAELAWRALAAHPLVDDVDAARALVEGLLGEKVAVRAAGTAADPVDLGSTAAR